MGADDDSGAATFVWSKRVAPAERALWEDRLFGLGETGGVIRADHRRETLEVEVFGGRGRLEGYRREFGGRIKRMKPVDWAAASARPVTLRIRDRLVITTAADVGGDYPNREVVRIPAGGAFGTGGHATTATCLRFLADVQKRASVGEWRLLDAGCGSGILGIAGIKLGAREAIGIDSDSRAVEIANDNAALNGVADQLTLEAADLLTWEAPGSALFDVVAANVFSSVLIRATARFREWLKPDGWLILSGILPDQAAAVVNRLEETNLSLDRSIERRGWVSLLARTR